MKGRVQLRVRLWLGARSPWVWVSPGLQRGGAVLSDSTGRCWGIFQSWIPLLYNSSGSGRFHSHISCPHRGPLSLKWQSRSVGVIVWEDERWDVWLKGFFVGRDWRSPKLPQVPGPARKWLTCDAGKPISQGPGWCSRKGSVHRSSIKSAEFLELDSIRRVLQRDIPVTALVI